MARTQRPPPMVCVTWEDAAQMDDGLWVENRAHEYAPHVHRQVGFLLARTRKGVVMSATWSPTLVSVRDSIPRGMIRSIEYLGPVERPPARTRTPRPTHADS